MRNISEIRVVGRPRNPTRKTGNRPVLYNPAKEGTPVLRLPIRNRKGRKSIRFLNLQKSRSLDLRKLRKNPSIAGNPIKPHRFLNRLRLTTQEIRTALLYGAALREGLWKETAPRREKPDRTAVPPV